jgi:hypothetical protein
LFHQLAAAPSICRILFIPDNAVRAALVSANARALTAG